jgi:hypothetical protein
MWRSSLICLTGDLELSWFYYSLMRSISSIFTGKDLTMRSSGMQMEESAYYCCSTALLTSSSLNLTMVGTKLMVPWSSLILMNLSLQTTNPLLVILKMWSWLQTRHFNCLVACWGLVLSFTEALIIDDFMHYSQRQSPQYKTLGMFLDSSNLEEHIAQW